jgi:hypothetical protein
LVLFSLQSAAGLPAGQLVLAMSIRISLLVEADSWVLQQYSMVLGIWGHLLSAVSFPSK